jgi:hypothetical protein
MSDPVVVVKLGNSEAETKANLKGALADYLQRVMGAEFTPLKADPDLDRFLDDLVEEMLHESQRCGRSHLVAQVAALMKLDLGDAQTNMFVCNLMKNFRIEKAKEKARREDENKAAEAARVMLGRFWLLIRNTLNPNYQQRMEQELSRLGPGGGVRG